MNPLIVLALCAGAALFTALLVKLRYDKDLAVLREQLTVSVANNERLKADVEHLKENPEFKVHIEPFVETKRATGYFSKSTAIEVGFQYQLLVHGIPCFEPHRIVKERHDEKEVSNEMIERFKAVAGETALLAASATPGGTAAKFLSIASTVVRRV